MTTTTSRAISVSPRRIRMSGLTATAVAVLAVAASVGVGQLVAGVLSPVSAPYRAVADAVVRWAPGWLVEFGKTLVLPGLGAGRADKVGLLVGIGVVLLLVAVGMGAATRSSVRPGTWAIVVLGGIGLASVVSSPVFGATDLAAPLAATGAGLWSLRWLHGKALAAAREATPAGAEAAPAVPVSDAAVFGGAGSGGAGSDPAVSDGAEPDGRRPERVARRELLVSGAVVGAGALGAGVIGNLLGAGTDINAGRAQVAPELRAARPAPPVPAGADFVADGTPTFLTSNADFYRIDTALSLPVKAASDWSMRIHGMVERELTVSYRDLLAGPLVERTITMTCVSNEVGGSLISTANFLGVDLRELLLRAGVQPGARQLLSTSLDGWTAGTPVDVVLEPGRGAMLALGMNGQPLPLEHGYPVRMVVPGLYGYVSATKWLADLELTTFEATDAFWIQRGWAPFGPIKTESRIDKPGYGDRVPAGRVTVAGIAWAQHRGITRVEVRVDGGPWQQAQLATEVSSDTWRMWRAFVNVPPGPHTVEARATDGTGIPQTEQVADPAPNGASGYPQVSFAAG